MPQLFQNVHEVKESLGDFKEPPRLFSRVPSLLSSTRSPIPRLLEHLRNTCHTPDTEATSQVMLTGPPGSPTKDTYTHGYLGYFRFFYHTNADVGILRCIFCVLLSLFPWSKFHKHNFGVKAYVRRYILKHLAKSPPKKIVPVSVPMAL